MKPSLTILSLLFSLTLPAQHFQWAKNFNSSGNLPLSFVDIDSNLNTFFASTAQNGIQINGDWLDASGTFDLFVAKYDPLGQPVWTWQIGAPSTTIIIQSLLADNEGNCFVGGAFNNTLDFDPSAQTLAFSPVGNTDAFVLKLNPQGVLQWVNIISSPGDDAVTACTLGNDGKWYFAGTSNGNVSFILNGSSLNFNGSNNNTWIESINADENTENVFIFNDAPAPAISDIEVTNDGLLIFSGQFSGTTDFSSDPNASFLHTSIGTSDIFVAALNQSLNQLAWLSKFSSGVGNTATSPALEMDQGGNLYLAAQFNGTLQSSVGVIPSTGATDIAIIKLNPPGDPTWIRSIGGQNAETILDLKYDSNRLYFVGTLQGINPVDMNPGTGINTITPSGLGPFICAFNNDGTYNWSQYFSSPGILNAHCLAVGPSNTFAFSGFMANSFDANPGNDVYTLSTDTFVNGLYINVLGECEWPYFKSAMDGPSVLCGANSYPYSVIASESTSSVEWIPPATSQIVAGQSTESIVLLAGNEPGALLAVPSNSCASAAPLSLELDISAVPVFLNQPADVAVAPASNAVFEVVCDDDNLEYIWQRNAGGGFSNLQNNLTFQGVDSPVLTIQNASLSLNENSFRCRVSRNDCIAFSQPAVLSVNEENGLENDFSSQIQCYPNPVTDFLFVSLPDKLIGEEVMLFNAYGYLVLKILVSQKLTTVNVAHLPSGCYVAHVAGSSISMEIIKN